jgi:dolichol kinase
MAGALIIAAGMATLIGTLPARAAHFAVATERTLWYQVGVFLLAFLLMLALPARRRHSAGLDSVRDDGREPNRYEGSVNR